MTPTIRIKRFGVIDRLFHLGLMLTFLVQTATGFGRLYIASAWGKKICALFGGYESALAVHQGVGVAMIAGFVLHTLVLLARVRWQSPLQSIFGPDSLVPNTTDVLHLGQRIRWFFGMGEAPRLDRWSYWEKFDYWAVYWGMPLLAVTGLMAMYPLFTSRFLPGWALNVSALLHRAEAILAVGYIFIVHFYIGHLRPMSFPMNEGMFSGSMSMEEAEVEKPAWVERLKKEGRLDTALTQAPPTWYRVLYFVFGYAALLTGVYLLVNGIAYSRWVSLH